MFEIIGVALGIVSPIVAWVFRMQTRLTSTEIRLENEKELRTALGERVTGIEARIFEVLNRIENKLDNKADKP